MRVAILSSSRADFGIYLPLLQELQKCQIPFDIIAFGTHLSFFHGRTIDSIRNEGFEVTYTLESLILGDSQEAISTSIGLTTLKFASFWAEHHDRFGLVFCLGDRFEMCAAVSAGIPFNIRFAHLHGGEKTLGAIDNIFRDQITHASSVHFTSTEEATQRVRTLIGDGATVMNVGALSLDGIENFQYYSNEEFYKLWGIKLDRPTILITIHSETVKPELNKKHAQELVLALNTLSSSYQLVITMPNADTDGMLLRSLLLTELKSKDSVYFIENFGRKAYFTMMTACSFMLGNTSSGIIEAASFKKYVINLGDRQEGRAVSRNVFQTGFSSEQILAQVREIEQLGEFMGNNIYWNGGAANKIIDYLIQYGQQI